MCRSTERAALARLGLDDAPEADVTAFLHTARTLGLDPFALGQIHLDPDRDPLVGPDRPGRLATLARRAATAAGARFAIAERAWCGDDGRWRDVWLTTDPPAAARVIVLRDGEPFPGVATLAESAARNRRGDLVALWRTKPAPCRAAAAAYHAGAHAFGGPQSRARGRVNRAELIARRGSPRRSHPTTGEVMKMIRIIRTLVDAIRRPKFAEGGVLPLSRSEQVGPWALLEPGGVDHHWFPDRGWVKATRPLTDEPPLGTLVDDGHGHVWRHDRDGWWCIGVSEGVSSWEAVCASGPVTLATSEDARDALGRA